MTFQRIDIGNIELLALLDGDAEAGPITESFPDIPIEDLLAWREREPGLYGEGDMWRLRVRAWLIRHPGGVVLVDTGVGQEGSPTLAWWPRPGALFASLAETGTPPGAIDSVVISHVHDDHIGGTVTFETNASGEEPVAVPAFPNARYLIQRADREYLHEEARTSSEDAALAQVLLQPLEDHDQLDLLDGDHDLADGIQLHHLPGHTPGHQIVRLRSRGSRAVISADTFNHPGQLPHPDWPSGPDWHHARAAAARRALLAELLSAPGTTVAPTHLTAAFGRVEAGRDGLAAWMPMERS
jgi:glyoxylase-like metal-dependent hydrolase (beta-lactamase superfamily II)